MRTLSAMPRHTRTEIASLLALREREGLSYAELSRRTGVNPRTLRGGRGAVFSALAKAEGLEVPLRRLTSIGVSPLVGPAVPLSTFDYTYDAQGHVTKRKRDRVGVAPGGGDMFQLDEY